jgi:hypothetical protein
MKTRLTVGQPSRPSPLFSKFGTGRKPILLGLALYLAPLALVAQSYSIDWSKIAGGGGTSTGGVYAVNGTIGQPDAGALSGGTFTLQGGFWSVLASQTPGAPLLSLWRTSTNTMIVAWPAPAPSWQLECATLLAYGTNSWTLLPPPYHTNATQCYCTEPVTADRKFYRLSKP